MSAADGMMTTDAPETASCEALQREIAREISEFPVLVYSKGTDAVPRCGFTAETRDFFADLGCSAHFIDVLDNLPKRETLSAMTDWPTLPKVFINGVFYGDTDTLEPLRASGELREILSQAATAQRGVGQTVCPEKP